MSRRGSGLPGYELREPLKSRPLGGAIVGGVMGLLVGMVAIATGAETSRGAIFGGYVVGGMSAGAFVGLTLPLFRHRIVGGLVVGLGAALWGKIATSFLGEPFDLAIATFIAVLFGTIYGVLLWDYQPNDAPEGRHPSP